MRKDFFTIALLTAFLAFSQEKNFIVRPYLELSSRVDTLVIPDKIYLNIVLDEVDNKNKKSTEELEKQLGIALKKLGINIEKNLLLMDMSSDFKKYFLKGQSIIKYKQYELVVNDAVMVGKVLAALENEGISNVNVDRAEYSKAAELLVKLKQKAVLKSKTDAEVC